MEEKENKHLACYNCSHYHPFYTRGYSHFDKQDYGLCIICGVKILIDDKHGYCTNYSGHFAYRRKCTRTAIKKLNDIAEDVDELLQILKEEIEENTI